MLGVTILSKRRRQANRNITKTSLGEFISLRLREGLVILILASTLYLFISLFTYHQADSGWSHYGNSNRIQNSGGLIGAWLADLLLLFFGYWSFILPLLLAYSGWLVYKHRFLKFDNQKIWLLVIGFRTLGFVLIIFSGTGLLNISFPLAGKQLPDHVGGVVGQIIAEILIHSSNFSGCVLILIAFFLIGITLFTGLSWLRLCEKLGQGTLRFFPYLFQKFQDLFKKKNVEKITEKVSQSILTEKKTSIKKRIEPQFSAAKTSEFKQFAEFNNEKSTKPVKQKTSFFRKNHESEVLEENFSTNHHSIPDFSKMMAGSTSLPDLSLLTPGDTSNSMNINSTELELRSREVEERLSDFGVSVKVVGVYPGPVVTRFEVQLAAGTKVSKITSLAKDLARSLSVVSVRVVEVIPGKSVIGIELPNESREMVSLQEVLASKAYINSRSAISLALGKDISGNPVVVDLAKMPHLLVAGTTGSGKSVGLNAMLLSLLYKATPEQLRLIMIDPKMLELSIYDGIGHLLTPVVTDMKDAASALRWCVVEMERRYRLMASLGVRNIMGYNLKIKEARDAAKPVMDPFPQEGTEPQPLLELPQIVVIADEFADMMVVVGKKVETLIARLAQKARAAGIHLILATQRPSVDVITGLIKANIPTRIAFQVSSKIDSRTILDQQGAEQLLGHGDMLYLPPGSGVPVRVHGAFVSDDDVHQVVSFLKQQAKPQYIENLFDDAPSTDFPASAYSDSLFGGESEEEDPFYDEAVEMITKIRRVSVSSIQRRFKIGYNRAARIVEAMEKAGVVSKMESNGSREVLAPSPIDSN